MFYKLLHLYSLCLKYFYYICKHTESQFNFTMVNNEDFSKQLKILLEYYELSASSFADKVGVQRSSISHLLSGRNKPSLDFVLKVLKEFPKVTWEWILYNKGNFPKNEEEENKSNAPTLFSNIEEQESVLTKKSNVNKMTPPLSSVVEKSVEQVIVFYTDGTCKVFHPKKK